jgi:L-aspartate oxidase
LSRANADADLIVVGAGAAGLFAGLTAARAGARVTLVSARPLAETASYWAQGGLAAALALEDSSELHLEDTLAAGRNLVRRSAAEVLTTEAPARFRDLEELGVRFDADRHGALALGLEGGHRVRRVAHAGGSATGRRILRQLSATVVESQAIEVLEDRRVQALATTPGGRVSGAQLDDGRLLIARAVVLASGGAAALWSRTTNPPGSYGSGLLLARAAGADLADLEFVQFHPTAVTGIRGREGFLVSEAVRGEGATLIDEHGERFTDELQPRDAVARAIVAHRGPVYLDMRAIDPARFPNVVEALRDAGHDPATEPVPVAPASHYVMGGIVTDLQGRSTVAGLYGVGECACTGLHGANRLASNSLLECMVIGRAAAEDISSKDKAGLPDITLPAWDESRVSDADEEVVVSHNWDELRRMMWNYVGIVRTSKRLERAQHRIGLLREEIAEYYAHFRVTSDLLELRNLVEVASLIVDSAYSRHESRGLHFSRDYPDALPKALPTVMQPPAARKR